MIMGEFSHTLDAKNRTILPAKLREKLGDQLVLIKGLDHCVAVYPIEAWNAFVNKLDALPDISARSVKMIIYASAFETEPDSQGRILIPQNLREHAGLSKDIVTIGMSDHAEIWDSENWRATAEGINSEEMKKTLLSLGF